MMDPLKVLEKQSGFLRLLVYLSDKKEKPLTEILDDREYGLQGIDEEIQ